MLNDRSAGLTSLLDRDGLYRDFLQIASFVRRSDGEGEEAARRSASVSAPVAPGFDGGGGTGGIGGLDGDGGGSEGAARPDGDDALGEPAWEGGFCRGDGDEGDDGSVAIPTWYGRAHPRPALAATQFLVLPNPADRTYNHRSSWRRREPRTCTPRDR